MAARADWFASEEDEAESAGEDDGEEALLAAELSPEAALEAAPDSTVEAGPVEDSVDLSGGADAETRS
jgi:hypothetical protein